jgi:hypothetical protein
MDSSYKDIILPLPDMMLDIVERDGDVIFNGDIEQLKYLASESHTRTSIYTNDPSNPLVKTITRKGGFAAVIDRDEIKLLTERDSIHIAYLKEEWDRETIPSHLLPAILAAFIMKADPALIARQIGCEVKDKTARSKASSNGSTTSSTSRRSKAQER